MPASDRSRIEEQVRTLHSGGSEDRREAAIALARTAIRSPRRRGAPEGWGEAIARALEDPDPAVRREVVYCAGEWAEGDTAPLLERLVLPSAGRADPDLGVRVAAVRALARTAGPGAAGALEAVALGDPDHDVRAAAVTAIGQLAQGEGRSRGPRRTVRRRGPVRTRGAGGGPRGRGEEAPAKGGMRTLLERIRDSDPSSLVCELAGEALEDSGG